MFKRKQYFLALIFSILFLNTSKAFAICPICTAGVSIGVGFSRYLGLDDTIAGIWIGALIVSLIMWTINWMNARNYKFKGRKIIITILYYVLTIGPLYWTKFIGHPDNSIYGIDKLVFGIIFGTLIFTISALWYNDIKTKNGGHAQFPFQKIVLTISPLIIISLMFFYLTK